MRSKRTKAVDIPQKVKKEVRERDNGLCVICGRPGMPNAHFIPRSQGGLGIAQNVVTLCTNCHHEFDHTVRRDELKEALRRYLKGKYLGWNEADLIYNKWASYKVGGVRWR